MKQKSGWHLPDKDNYFSDILDKQAEDIETRFMEGTVASDRKANGFQREHLEVALTYVKQFEVAIDVGAHIGFWAWDMGNRFKTVYAFEPALDCYACLLKNTEDQPNVIPANVAVGDRDGECALIDDPRRINKVGVNTGARYVNPRGQGVKMITLDSLRLDRCDFLKIDVEGFEYQVLKGAKKLIKRFRPIVSLETDKRFSGPRYGIPNTLVHEFMKERDYLIAEKMRPDTVFIPKP